MVSEYDKVNDRLVRLIENCRPVMSHFTKYWFEVELFGSKEQSVYKCKVVNYYLQKIDDRIVHLINKGYDDVDIYEHLDKDYHNFIFNLIQFVHHC